ncbi:MAG TPA: type I-E CRISPR-associated endoribonuclease Cas2e [Longimicrobiales bacterium]
MVVIVLERVPASVRGELSRWMLEVRTGVFVGRVSALVRDKLWEFIEARVAEEGACFLIHRAEGEQGFNIRVAGDPSRSVEDFDGIGLIRIHSHKDT